ncbi:ferredoxin [Mycolicibacterium vaccae]|uniref:ferredoxin n=1 Tax=Mycolicibacterium vaccae TaxID=1810 RepID=UPI003D046FFA
MKVIVDTDLCMGNGVCEALAPDLFTVTDSGAVQLLVDEIPPDRADAAADAVSSCPARALTRQT